MFEGGLVAESIRLGASLEGVSLVVTKITRGAVTDHTPDQPSMWTIIEFQVPDSDADAVASALIGVLDEPGWYADFQSDDEIFVVFPGRVFRYARGDEAARAEAESYGRAHGVPQSQLDW